MSATPQKLQTLAGLLAMPEEDALAIIQELVEQEPWLQEALEELTETSIGQWQAEYTRLFLSGYPTTPCPPFESAYRHGQMWGPAVDELGSLYQRIGLESNEVPNDYLGTILGCAAYLEDNNDPAAEQLKNELWRKHLAVWLPRFGEDLISHSKLKIYRELGKQLILLFTEQTEATQAHD